MDDGASALRDRPRPRTPGAIARAGSRPVLQPHHRRRRAAALAVLAGLALILGLETGASGGGSAVNHHLAAEAGFFTRIHTLGGVGPGSFTFAERSAENAAINRTLTRTPYVRIAGSQHREIALTFDDGPGPYTPEVLAVLRRESVPGTFFEVGIAEQDFHPGTSEIVGAGYPIGDHTENHSPMSHLTRHDQRVQLLQDAAALHKWGAPFPRLFRPPYGLWNNTTLKLLHHFHMLMVMWTVDTNDYLMPGVTSIVRSAVSGARPGAIILLHDAGGNRSETVAALPKIIAKLRKKGYRFVTVPRLLLDNPAPANQQISSVTGGG